MRRFGESAFGGTTPHNGYCGEEDQGQMGALSALMKIGLFSVRGACDADPIYEITSHQKDFARGGNKKWGKSPIQ